MASRLPRTDRGETTGHRPDEDRQTGGYAAAMIAFTLLVTLAAATAALTGRNLPRRIGVYDLVVITAGTHKIARMLSKNTVTRPLRAPFTRYRGSAGPAELNEEARYPSGPRHVIGELVSCPFCLDMWVVTAHMIGMVFAPRVTRLVAATFTALAGADFLHFAYARAMHAAEGH